MYSTDCVPPKFYGLPKIHKPDTPLRPIVPSCGSVTYVKQLFLAPGECLSSYNVSALFTSFPVD